MYLLLFLVGLIGFVSMAALSLVGGHGHQHGHGNHTLDSGHGHAGHSHAGHGHVGAGHAAHGPSTPAHTGNHGVAHDHTGVSQGAGSSPLHVRTVAARGVKVAGAKATDGRNFPSWLLISPLDIFSLALGAGSAGLLAAGRFAEPLLLMLAILGGIVFNYALIRPMMGFLLSFASKPIDGLAGALATTGQATMRFDANGRGLLKLNLDGEIFQVLAHLDPAEVAQGVTVQSGDTLLVIDIDPVRNTCQVSKEMAS